MYYLNIKPNKFVDFKPNKFVDFRIIIYKIIVSIYLKESLLP